MWMYRGERKKEGSTGLTEGASGKVPFLVFQKNKKGEYPRALLGPRPVVSCWKSRGGS